MPNWLISLIIAVGVSAWFFNKLQQSTGYGSTNRSLTAAVLSGIFIFGVLLTILKMIGG